MASMVSAPINVPHGIGGRYRHGHHQHYAAHHHYNSHAVNSAFRKISTPIASLQQQQQQQQQRTAQASATQPRATLFPLNPSLEDELNRLFADFRVEHVHSPPRTDEVWEEFKHNGKDYEYCPDDMMSMASPPNSKKKSKKPLPTECVFCKNNGEDVKIYKKHLLKNADGKILCPILRKYVCPICSASGDNAHTLKYCPNNKQGPQTLASMNTLKMLRNSTGRRRSK